MLEPQLREPRPGLVAPRSADRCQFAVNRDCGFPIICFLEQMGGIESRLIKPKKLARAIGSNAFLDHAIISR